MKTKSAYILTLCAVLFPGLALAASPENANMEVTASVSNSCTITANPLAFGAYDTVAKAAVNGTAVLDIACTKGTSETISLDAGLHPTGSSTAAAPLRQLANGTDVLSYFLYSDLVGPVVWGADTSTVSRVAASSSDEPVTVYGQIASGQGGGYAAGDFADTVVASVIF